MARYQSPVRPGDELDYGDEFAIAHGSISAVEHPYELTEDEVASLIKKRKKAHKKKRPIGFTAVWPDE